MFALLSPSDEEEEEPQIEGPQPIEVVPWPAVCSMFTMCKAALTVNLSVLPSSQLSLIPPQLLSEIVDGLTLSLNELQALPSGTIHSGVVVGARSTDQCLQNITRQPLSRLSIVKNNNLSSSYLREMPELKDLRLTACPKLAQNLVVKTPELRSPILSKLHLHTLHLSDCGLTDALLVELVGFSHLIPTLRDLDVSGNGELTSEGLTRLAYYEHLEELNVAGTQFRAMEVLFSLERLRVFNCGFTLVGDTEVELLANIPRLHSQLSVLNLECTNITDVSVVHLEALTFLRTLNLSGNMLTSHNAPSLARLSNLEALSLAGTDLLTLPHGLETREFPPTFLSKLSHLRSLDARETCGVFLPEVLHLTTLNLAQVSSPPLDAQIHWLEKGPNKDIKSSSATSHTTRVNERKKSEKVQSEEKISLPERYDVRTGKCEKMNFRQSSVSDQFFASSYSLSFLAHVQTLDLSHTKVTDEVWFYLRHLRCLTSLDVSHTNVGQSCKRCIVGKLVSSCPFGFVSHLLPLTSLTATNTQIVPSMLLLHFPPSLTSLDLRKNPLTWDGELAQLHKKLGSLFLDQGIQPNEPPSSRVTWVPSSPAFIPLPVPSVDKYSTYCDYLACWQTHPCSLKHNTSIHFAREELLRMRYLPQCVRFPLGLSFIQGITRSRHDPILNPNAASFVDSSNLQQMQ